MNISAKKIELRIAELELTKREVAERSGLCRQNVSTIILRGTCAPRTANKLAKALECTVEDLMA